MKFRFNIKSNIIRGPLSKRPVLLILLLCVVLWLATVACSLVNLLADYYFPYEGRVIKISSHWTDVVTFETTLWDHLIVKTPQGKVVDKVVGRQYRLLMRIKPGDFVIKSRGFSNPVRPRDKLTTSEILY